MRNLIKNKKESSIPVLRKIEKGRESEKEWVLTVMEYIKCVVPESKEHIGKRMMREWCPVAAEALMFLMLENGYEMWMEEAEMDDTDDGSFILTKKPKYTEKRGSGRKFGGWGNDGIKRFNTLYQRIKEQRNKQTTGKSLEQKLLDLAKEKGLAGKKRRLADMQQGEAPLCDMPLHCLIV